MPSWNVHIAHVERLEATCGLEALGVRDANVFLLGNMVPDIYVGYMVPDTTTILRYGQTHFADPHVVPIPHFERFWELYGAHRTGDDRDLALGVYAHLVCDARYNAATRDFLAAHGIPRGDKTRIRKQGDFALFGRTHAISSVPVADERALGAAARFAQYPIEEPDVRATCDVVAGIVEENQAGFIAGTPDYNMLTPEFFAATIDDVHASLLELLPQL